MLSRNASNRDFGQNRPYSRRGVSSRRGNSSVFRSLSRNRYRPAGHWAAMANTGTITNSGRAAAMRELPEVRSSAAISGFRPRRSPTRIRRVQWIDQERTAESATGGQRTIKAG
jgi:hypothetical protein